MLAVCFEWGEVAPVFGGVDDVMRTTCFQQMAQAKFYLQLWDDATMLEVPEDADTRVVGGSPCRDGVSRA